MGIVGLWSLLESAQEDVSLSECCGQRIAVDLSGWIVSFTTISMDSQKPSRSSGTPKSFLANRNLFFRALNISKLGIILVFVIDGPQAPSQKGKHNREAFFQECQQYKSLLTALGFLVLEAKGEAEKMCAELNMQNLVDGVLTSDGDSIVYGAQVIYKGIFTEKRDHKAAKFTTARMKSELDLDHKDLVAFALFSKGDISHGVHSVGEKKFLQLHKELKRNGIDDVLERIKSWASILEESELHTLESKVRRLALQQDPDFPRHDIIDEFLAPSNTLPELSQVCMKAPNYQAVCEILHEKLHFSHDTAAKHLIPWMTKMSIIGILPGIHVQPLEIIKTCKEQYEKCYTVKWKKLDCDKGSSDPSSYEFNISSTLFASKYPDMCKNFEVASSPKRSKRRQTIDPNQRKLSDMFKVVKKSTCTENLPDKR